MTCPICGGTGLDPDTGVCELCNGAGEVNSAVNLWYRISELEKEVTLMRKVIHHIEMRLIERGQ